MADDTDATEIPPIGCGFWFGWVLATIVGMAIGWAAGWGVTFIAPPRWSTVILGAPVGAAVGTFQWLALRARLRGAGWWVLASTVGWSAGFYLGVELSYLRGFSEIAFGATIGATVGAILGILQWLVLVRQIRRAGWWIPLSSAAWATSLLIYRPGISGIGAWYGVFPGILTGWAIVWLLRRPAKVALEVE